MTNKITKIFIFIVFSLITTNCQSSRADYNKEKQNVTKYLKSSSSDSLSKQMDLNNLDRCPILIKQNPWTEDGVRQVWLDEARHIISKGIGLDVSESKSYEIMNHPKNKNWKLVYVGKWKDIEAINKKVRLIAMQYNVTKEKSGVMRVYYESLDDKNKNIPEMPLKLIKPTYGDELCTLKWHNKYGYNAIAENYRELKPGFWNWIFRKHDLVITGKIIEVKE